MSASADVVAKRLKTGHGIQRGQERYGFTREEVLKITRELRLYVKGNARPTLFDVINEEEAAEAGRKRYLLRYSGRVVHLVYELSSSIIVTFLPAPDASGLTSGFERYGLDSETIAVLAQELASYEKENVPPRTFEIWKHRLDTRITHSGVNTYIVFWIRYTAPIYTGQVIKLLYDTKTTAIVLFFPRPDCFEIRNARLRSLGIAYKPFLKREWKDVPQDEC